MLIAVMNKAVTRFIDDHSSEIFKKVAEFLSLAIILKIIWFFPHAISC